ncbi:MAG: Glutamate--tRNA ligase [Alphaproteobacteria bacterium MarineAlpha2_Bin1]|nr:MAG: Glutamate--tRNA ligase [Alphaproteobacteria bacterium MarineAlpha2_Bin1]|tara:strand:+ start:49 stop:1449 length:1401 start_codon:yes stop_codon:yes gene_type:complete
MSEVRTRFAPSPTGSLHIGGARTALFNWLYAMNQEGKFYLRIEDTDKLRSTEDAINAIFVGLKWLELNWEKEVIFQSQNIQRYKEVVNYLLEKNSAYYCYASEIELQEMKRKAREKGLIKSYNGLWRDRTPTKEEQKIKPVIRFKSPQHGQTILNDLVQGKVVVNNNQLDDMILLRSDGTPTYTLSVVVDDFDMNITHIIRGDDHLNNAVRQVNIFNALGWEIPNFAHIPLIHDSNGKKLSKRNNAVGVDEYKDMGILPEAMKNYLLRLGWSHGNDEIISENDAIKFFSIENIRKAASRFDLKKLKNINSYYIKNTSQAKILNLVINLLKEIYEEEIIQENLYKLKFIFDDLIERSDNIKDIFLNSKFLFEKNIDLNKDATKIIDNSKKDIIKNFATFLQNINDWNIDDIENSTKKFANNNDLSLKDIAMPLRACITGNKNSPNIFKIMFILGKNNTIKRIKKYFL